MAPQVSRPEFPWSSPIVIVKPEEAPQHEGASVGAAAGTPPPVASSSQRAAAYSNLMRENMNLKKTLKERLKREDAIREVFIRSHEKEQELSARSLRLDARELELKDLEARMQIEKKRFEEERSTQIDTKSKDRIRVLEEMLAKCLGRKGTNHDTFMLHQEKEHHLAKKEAELEVREAQLKDEDERLRIKKEALDEQQLVVDKQDTEKMKLAESPETERPQKWPCFSRAPSPCNVLDLGVWELFPPADPAIFEGWDLPVPFDSMNEEIIYKLRAHDYYKGWLDCVRAFDKANPGKASIRSSRTMFNTGRDAGGILGWSVFCEEDNQKHLDIRLDGRKWKREDISPSHATERVDHLGFWSGMKRGIQNAQKAFSGKMKDESIYWATAAHEEDEKSQTSTPTVRGGHQSGIATGGQTHETKALGHEGLSFWSFFLGSSRDRSKRGSGGCVRGSGGLHESSSDNLSTKAVVGKEDVAQYDNTDNWSEI